jgi:carbamoyl-phosphate synthase large subunit
MTSGYLLVASASAKVALVRAAQDAVRRTNSHGLVVAGDSDLRAPARHVADHFWAMPAPVCGNAAELLAGCRERGISVVLPTRDGELAFWADVRARFVAAGISVLVADPESVRRCLDKLAFAKFGENTGLPIIPAALTPSECGEGPYVVKPRFGAGSAGIGLRLDLARARDHAARLEQPIFQPFVEGREISIDAWMNRAGEPHGIVLRNRDRVVNGESQITTTFRAPAIEAQADAVLRALRLRGHAVMQAIVDAQERIHVIEVNARFGGASTAAIAAGLDSLYWSLSELREPETIPPFARIPGEVRQVRLAQDMIIHDPGV